MAFPKVEKDEITSQNTNVTSHVINMPPGINAGDLLVCIFGNDSASATITFAGDWTEIFENGSFGCTLGIAYKNAAGSDTLTVTTSTAQQSASVVYRISGNVDPSTQAPEVSVGATAQSVNPDPDSLTPTGGAKDYLYFAVHTHNGDRVTTAFPTNYDGDQQQIETTGAGNGPISLATASRDLNAASDDPGTFTFAGGSTGWNAATIAIHPPVETTAEAFFSSSTILRLDSASTRSSEFFSGPFDKGFDSGFGDPFAVGLITFDTSVISTVDIAATAVFTANSEVTIGSELSIVASASATFNQETDLIESVSLLSVAEALFQPAGSIGAPTITSVVLGDSKNTITFTSVPTATSHNIYFDTTSGVTKSDTKITSVTSPFIHQGLINGTEYFYVATAQDAFAEYEVSNEVSAIPTGSVIVVLTNPSASLTSTTSTTLSSDVSFSAVSLLTMETQQAGFVNTELSLLSSGVLNITSEAINSVQVSFINSSALTSVGSIIGGISIGSLLSVTPKNKSNIIIYEEQAGSTSHNLYFKNTKGVTKSNGVKITEVSSPFTHTGLVNGITYHYVYTAVFAEGESDVSNELSGIPVPVDRVEFALSERGIKSPCRVSTTANIILSGTQTIDGVVLSVNDRVLVKDQTTGSENGIYAVDTGIWNRQPDFDGNTDIDQSTLITVHTGDDNQGIWRITTNGPIVVGTTSLSFVKVLSF